MNAYALVMSFDTKLLEETSIQGYMLAKLLNICQGSFFCVFFSIVVLYRRIILNGIIFVLCWFIQHKLIKK